MTFRDMIEVMDELLTVEQAAEKLKMHPDTIRRLLRDKQLPGVKLGKRQWRISEDSLKAYLQRTPESKQ
jgi:excisionase family DNA binding protein